ncbi:MAG TPA: 30S ribosomal protein S9 [bacterium]|jgi:small subunit ribosomal protein S9|nr:30S ribosomal protein S9 [bacterium]HNT66920.1 30S ribosomal protein S9 [bacterium]HOX85961.1 30S ribosomal protein S9 [bacterium]HPG45056.1 30S ribosomal protein S9 [bacterium]HPM97298.1 30S ribosomal protein S9 [bacterium]
MKGNEVIATGRRKDAVARVRLMPGSGQFSVNDRELLDYFKRDTLKMIIEQPFSVTDTLGSYDVRATVKGGGLTGQAGALLLGIARALVKANDSLQPTLRRNGFLTRDPRMVERKKYGQAKARKRFQFSKR